VVKKTLRRKKGLADQPTILGAAGVKANNCCPGPDTINITMCCSFGPRLGQRSRFDGAGGGHIHKAKIRAI
jgi:hypothetical protein